MGTLEVKKINLNSIESLNSIHEGKPIFIVGNGTGLNDLTENEIKTINKNIIIGCNISHLIFKKTDYFISGHLSHLLFNYHYGDCNNRIFQGHPILSSEDKDLMKIIQITERNIVTPPSNIVKPLNPETPIAGAEQICFSATHLAVILGAKKIIYLGFDHNSINHYYSNEKYIDIIKKQTYELVELYKENKFASEDINDFLHINIEPDPKTGDFKHWSGSFLRKYDRTLNYLKNAFKHISQYGIEAISIEEDSIITKAGASYKKLEEIKEIN